MNVILSSIPAVFWNECNTTLHTSLVGLLQGNEHKGTNDREACSFKLHQNISLISEQNVFIVKWTICKGTVQIEYIRETKHSCEHLFSNVYKVTEAPQKKTGVIFTRTDSSLFIGDVDGPNCLLVDVTVIQDVEELIAVLSSVNNVKSDIDNIDYVYVYPLTLGKQWYVAARHELLADAVIQESHESYVASVLPL